MRRSLRSRPRSRSRCRQPSDLSDPRDRGAAARRPLVSSYLAPVSSRTESTAAESVLDHIGPGRRPDRAAGQRRAGHPARRHRGRRRPTRRRARPPDARPARPPVPPRRVRRPPAPRLVLPVARHPAVLPRRARSTSCRTTSARCATSCATRTHRSAGARRRLAARPPRLLQPRAERRLRRLVHRPGPVLPRGQPRRCRGPSAATRSTSARSSAGSRPTTRSSRCRPAPTERARPTRIAALRRRADPRRGHDPDRHRLDPQRHPRRRCATTATSASTPSCSPTA